MLSVNVKVTALFQSNGNQRDQRKVQLIEGTSFPEMDLKQRK